MIVYLEISFAYMYTNIVLHLLTYFCIKVYSRVFWILLLDTSITSPSLQRLLFLSRARAGKQLSLDNTSPPCNAQIQWTSTQEIHFPEWGKIQNVNWAADICKRSRQSDRRIPRPSQDTSYRLITELHCFAFFRGGSISVSLALIVVVTHWSKLEIVKLLCFTVP